MTRVEFKRMAREGAGLTHLTDQRLDEMYDDAQKAIDVYKLKHPAEWAACEKLAQQRAQQHN
jgi:hypothetical protein